MNDFSEIEGELKKTTPGAGPPELLTGIENALAQQGPTTPTSGMLRRRIRARELAAVRARAVSLARHFFCCWPEWTTNSNRPAGAGGRGQRQLRKPLVAICDLCPLA